MPTRPTRPTRPIPTRATARTSPGSVGVGALERCVGDVDRFFNDHWAQAPLLRRPGSDRAFDDLASLDDLDHMVASLGLPASRLRMVANGTALARSSYTTRTGGRSEDVVSPALVYARYCEGATIVLESLHRYWRPLTDFCRELELALGHRLQVNAYVTPPGAQGFAVHRDDHDVFVLQVSGSKHWIVYDRDDEQRVLIDEPIARGAALYIPKGFPHAASTEQRASAHLTVGIVTHDGIEVLREMTKLAEDEPAFQERLPGAAALDLASLRATVERQLDEVRAWLDKIDLDELTRRVARRVMSSAQPVVRGQLRQLEHVENIDLTTTVVRRRGATCALLTKDDVLTVLLVDRELQMPGFVEPAMQEIARGERLIVRDLADLLDADSAVVLVRRLVREGLLEVAVDE